MVGTSVTNSIFAQNWILVEKFDNSNYVIKSDVIAINCGDSSCYSLVQHTGESSEYSWRLYNSNIFAISWYLIYIAPNTYQQNLPKVFNINEGTSPTRAHYFVASDDNSIILKSNDSGKTFKKIILESGYNEINNFAMYDTNYGFATNDNAFFTTKDGWETFERQPKLSASQKYYSPTFVDSNTLVMSYIANHRWNDGKGYAFVKYHIEENKWDTLYFFDRDSAVWIDVLWSIDIVNDTLIFASGARSVDSLDGYLDVVYRSTDGGYNWKIVLLEKELKKPAVGLFNKIAFHDEKNGIAVGRYGKIAMTNDGGDTWVYEPYPNDMKNCRKMQVCWAGRTPLIGTWDAGIFRYEGDFFKFPEDTTSVVDDLITNYQLLITPNPAGEYIEINFERCPTSSRCRTSVKIEIYNVLGECVKTLPIHPMTPSHRMNIEDLPAGIYFVRIGKLVGRFVKM